MSNQINDGGPAFPHKRQIRCNGEVIDSEMEPGMTLRDYFAAAALQGLLSGYLHRAKLDNDGALMIPESIYETAYRSADEMLIAKEIEP